MPNRTANEDNVLEEKLKDNGLASEKDEDIQWNFEKFLIDTTGKVVAQFAPDITPDDARVVGTIEKLLA